MRRSLYADAYDMITVFTQVLLNWTAASTCMKGTVEGISHFFRHGGSFRHEAGQTVQRCLHEIHRYSFMLQWQPEGKMLSWLYVRRSNIVHCIIHNRNYII